MTHVLVATDGSEQSLKAARYLRELFHASLEKITVIAVVRPLAAVPFASDFGEEELAAAVAEAARGGGGRAGDSLGPPPAPGSGVPGHGRLGRS